MPGEKRTLIATNGRLGFIDAGRSLAIILMLHGHFISMTFKDSAVMSKIALDEGSSGSLLFDLRFFLSGITAPLFFTITGLVFTYLLLKEKHLHFWEQKRVKKGIRRAITIILIGYALQLNLKNVHHYLSGAQNERIFAFHVLQCIGLSLLFLIIFHGIVRVLKLKNLYPILIFFGMVIFIASPFIRGQEEYFPNWAPAIVQNILHGPHSVFPIFPWVGYVFVGGGIGAYLIEKPKIIADNYKPYIIGSLGITVLMLISFCIRQIGQAADIDYSYGLLLRPFRHISIIIVILLALLLVEKRSKFRIPFFITMGKNTLSIYIIHVIVLYGAFFGFGIKTYINKSLTLIEANIGAIIFVLALGVITVLQLKIRQLIKSKKSL